MTKKTPGLTTKLMLKSDDARWNKVKSFAAENGFSRDLNSAVLELIDRGLKA